MRSLSWIATGFVIVALRVTVGSWDLMADPVGWALVLLGTRWLPPGVAHRAALLALAAAALVVAAVTWAPHVADRVADADPALVWAIGLPGLAYVVLLAHSLLKAARAGGDRRGAFWWSIVRTLTAVVALAPVLVIGGGIAAVAGVAAALSVLTPLVTVVLLLRHASRPWAQPAPVEHAKAA